MRPYAFVMSAMSGIAAFAAVQYGYMWWHDRRERLPLLLAGFAIAVGVQCAVIVSFSAATAVPELSAHWTCAPPSGCWPMPSSST